MIMSCSKKWDAPELIDDSNKSQTEEITALTDITVPNNFNWKTVKDIEINISSSSDGLVEAISTKGFIYQKAFLAKDQEYTMKLTIPTYESNIKLKMNDRIELLNISSGNVSSFFN